jgi:hypothetical protein
MNNDFRLRNPNKVKIALQKSIWGRIPPIDLPPDYQPPTVDESSKQKHKQSTTANNDEYMAALHRRWDVSNKTAASRYVDDFDRLPDSTVFIELSHKGFCETETPEYKGYNITSNQVYLNENYSNLDECFEAFKKALSERMYSARKSKLPYNAFINRNELIKKRYTDGVHCIIGILSMSLLLTIRCALEQKDFASGIIIGIKTFLISTGFLFLITLISYMIYDAFKRNRNS